MKRLFLLLIPLSLISAGSARASMVQRVAESQARGLSGSGVEILLRNGPGTNIDFSETDEVVQRVWLDDPGFATIDFDGKLCDPNDRCDPQNGGGASIIHLRRVVGITFPNIPRANSTLLTVVTNSGEGKKTYLFKISYGGGAAQYSVIPDNQGALGNGITINNGRVANWDDVERGLRLAIEQKLLLPDSPVISRTNQFLAAVRNGSGINQAMITSGLSMAIVSRLAQMGYQTLLPASLPPSPEQIPAPVPQPGG